MTLEQLVTVLQPIISNGEIHTREDRGITVERFMDLFGNCELTYTSLVNKGTELGWASIFEEWRERGLIE